MKRKYKISVEFWYKECGVGNWERAIKNKTYWTAVSALLNYFKMKILADRDEIVFFEYSKDGWKEKEWLNK